MSTKHGISLGPMWKTSYEQLWVLFAILLIPTRRMRATLEVLVLVAGSGHTDKCVMYLHLLVDLLFVANVHLLVQPLARHLPINIGGFGCRLGTQTNGRAAINCAGNLLLHAGPRHASPNPEPRHRYFVLSQIFRGGQKQTKKYKQIIRCRRLSSVFLPNSCPFHIPFLDALASPGLGE